MTPSSRPETMTSWKVCQFEDVKIRVEWLNDSRLVLLSPNVTVNGLAGAADSRTWIVWLFSEPLAVGSQPASGSVGAVAKLLHSATFELPPSSETTTAGRFCA